jgi:hypothetical protein
LELGVVFATLGLAFACGGQYDVGSGETGGVGGEAGAGDTGSGGSNASGQGGTSTSGGRNGIGGDTLAGTAGMPPGGASGVSGSSSGGTAGEPCGFPVESLPDYEIASPEVVWDRINLFLHGNTRAPFEPLPAPPVSVAWVQSRVLAVLEEQYVEDGRAPSGLEDFFRNWALEGEEGDNVEFWASSFVRGNFADFFAEVDDRVSFMSDRDFLVVHPNSTRRGVWMVQNIFGLNVPLPPPEVEIKPLAAVPGQTRREVVQGAVTYAQCAGCHVIFDPLGFSLEHYDALGDYRTTENGLPIDASGTYDQASKYLVFSSIDDLAGQFPALCEVQTTFARALFEYALDRAHDGALSAYHASELRYVIREFRDGNLDLEFLLRAIASTPSFLRE